MDAYEATRIVFSRIQSLDPENASKIMGLLLIQDHGEKEMIRLAFGPEALLQSLILKARNDLGLSSNTPSTPSTPSSPSPFFSKNNNNTNPISISISRQNSSSSFPLPPSRMQSNNQNSNNNNNDNNNNNLTSPGSLSSWAPSSFSDHLHNPDDLISSNSSSYAAAVNGFSALAGSNSSDLIDEFQLQDQLFFLNDGPKNNSDLFYPPEFATSPNNSSTDGMLFPSYAANWGATAMNNSNHHRRSSSVTDMINLGGLSSDPLGAGLGWKPCLYYARGYCKNGTTCRFLHDSTADPAMVVGSPNNLDAMEQCQELLLRSSKTHQQQQQQQLRLSTASQLMASAAAFPYTATSAGKCMNILLQQQQQNDNQRAAAAAAAALMLGEDFNKFGRARMERNEFSSSPGGGGGGGGGGGMVNPGSRQIYLTFPADSTFREEDVSNYFSIYGPVQDVRIPYQQKRMFGFVTFVYAETVKFILAKGNPHFVCDARVLVKPYKEKGKVPDKKQQQQQQQFERGDFSACTTPTGLDSRDPYDLHLGARMFNNNSQDVMLRRKLEEQQADLQQATELQSRRLMGLQLLDIKKHHHHRNLSAGAALNIPSPTQLHSPYMFNHCFIPPSSLSNRSSPEFHEEINCESPKLQPQNLMNTANSKDELVFGDDINSNGSGSDVKESPKLDDDCNFNDSLEHNLPDSPFASPIKSGGDPPFYPSTEAAAAAAASSSSSSSSLIASSAILPATSTLDMASLKSCFFQIPRFSSDHGAIGM